MQYFAACKISYQGISETQLFHIHISLLSKQSVELVDVFKVIPTLKLTQIMFMVCMTYQRT